MLKLPLFCALSLSGLFLAPQEPGSMERAGAIIRERVAPLVADPSAGVILLPPGGIFIEGRGELEFKEQGRRVVVAAGTLFRVDGEPLEGRRTLAPGQELELCTPAGERRFVLRGHSLEELAGRSLTAPVRGGVEGERLLWVGVDTLHEPARHQGRFRLSASDAAGSFELEVEDGQVRSASIDGEPVPAEQIELQGRRVRLLDQAGKLNLSLDLGLHGGATWSQRRTTRAFAGISVSAAEDAGQEGLVVTRVVPSSPAEFAGMREHDVILSLEGVPGVRTEHFARILKSKKPGEAITFELLREGTVRRIEVQLSEKPDPVTGAPVAATRMLDVTGVPGDLLSSQRLEVRRLALEHGGTLEGLRLQAGAAPPDPRLDRLLEHLERMQKRLDAIEARLGELQPRQE